MRFDLEVPDPAAMRTGKEGHTLVAPSTVLHRIHPSRFAPDQFNDTDKGNARFSPICNAAGDIIPTIYAAQSFECAACEIILRCPDTPIDPRTGKPPFQIVHPSDFAAHSHSSVVVTEELKLVDLTTLGQRKLGVDQNALLAGPRSTYPATRAWAEAIHANCPTAQGIYYSSFQYGPEYAVVLFGDRIAAGILAASTTRLVADTACRDELRNLAAALSIEYEDV